MKKWIVTPLAIVESTDTTAIEEAVSWVREWTDSSEQTHRSVIERVDSEGEPTGRWDVVADDRGQDPMSSEVISTHPTEAEAEAEAARLNNAIDAEIRSAILQDEIDLPDDAEPYMHDMQSGRPYVGSRRVVINIRVRDEAGAVEFDLVARWADDRNPCTGRTLRADLVASTIATEYSAALAKARAERDAELAEDAE